MVGSSVDDDWVFSSAPDEPLTLVLVGCIGTGKSATGNSILQKKAFMSGINSAAITSACELHTTVLEDGQVLNVIDTPGLLNATVEDKYIGKEIVNCVNMAKDGIHAVLVVLSVWKPFTAEQAAAISSLWTLFGKKIADHMIVVFTGGDELEFSGKTLEAYVGDSKALKELLHQCEDRCVVFNNRTRDQRKKDEQVEDLLSLVNLVVAKNGGKPYMDELSVELKKEARKLHDQTEEVSNPENQNKLFLKLKQEARELHDQTKVISDQENHIELSVELKKEARKLYDQTEEVSDLKNQNDLSMELKKAGELQDQTKEVSDQDNHNESSVELKKEARKLFDQTEEVSDPENQNVLFLKLKQEARELDNQRKVLSDQENHNELSMELKKEDRKRYDQTGEVSEPKNQNELSVELKEDAGELQDQKKEFCNQDNHNESSVELKNEARKLHDLTEEISDQEDDNPGHVVNFLLFIALSCVALVIILKLQ